MFPNLNVYNLPQEQVEPIPASLIKRITAYLIDSLFFLFTIYNPFMSIFLSRIGVPEAESVAELEIFLHENPKIEFAILIGILAVLFVYLLYFVIMESLAAVTIGEFFMKIKVLRTNKAKAETSKLILRNLTKTILIILLPIDCIGYITHKKRYSDIISDTDMFYIPSLRLIE